MRNLAISLASLSILCLSLSAPAAVRVWVESSGVMIMPDRPAGERQQIQRSGVRNEYVTAQIALRADEAPAQPLSFEWTELRGPAGATIPKPNITLYRAADIAVDHPKEQINPKDPLRSRRHGSFPDALVPLLLADGPNVANIIAPEKDKTISFWVDIFIPAKTPAGDYTGTITAKGAGDIAVRITVLDAEIPPENTIPCVFNFRLFPHVQANVENYVAEVMRHRLQPTNGHTLDNYLQSEKGTALIDKLNPDGRGFVALNIGDDKAPSEKRQEKILADLKMAEEHLKKRGLFDRAFIYLKDEPGKSEMEGPTAVAKLIIDKAPQWKDKLLDTYNREDGELDKLIVHHVRAFKCYGPWVQIQAKLDGRAEWDRRREKGQQLWFYCSNAQGVPFPTFDVNQQDLAWEPRVMPWAYWYEKAYGHLYWDLMFNPAWELNKKFPPGDGELMYPGDLSMAGAPAWALVKDIKAPVISRRMKLHREGLEEWEMLRAAEKKVGRDKVEQIVAKVYRNIGLTPWGDPKYDPANPMWSYKEEDWDAAREEVLKILVAK